MIIKHIVELETFINEDSNEPTAKIILAMPESDRNQFFAEAGRDLVAEFLQQANDGNTWAELRVAK